MSQGLHQGIFDFSDGFDRSRPSQTDHHQSENITTTVYDPTASGGNMLSEMFDFHHAGVASSATQLLTDQISSGYYARLQQRPPPMNSWNPNTVGMLMNPHHLQHQQQPTICSSSPVDETQIPQALPLHHHHHHNFVNNHAPTLQVQGGLSLSLSSSMQQPFEIAKEETPASSLYYNNINIPLQQGQLGFNGQMGVLNILRHSKYAKAARELLEEFCSVNRDDHDVKNRKGKRHRSDSSSIPNQPANYCSSSSSKLQSEPNLSSSQRFEQQRRKSGLLSMLDEVDRRYNYYCEQMQMIVNSFDAVMDLGAAKPYTGLAQKAMSRHFRCLKDGVIAQLKHTCEVLGDKDTGITSGMTKGETPRLKILDRNLRQQRSFNHMGMMEQETWRPQRGLPERSVNILRAWLFEHFLHPYPSDGDKHLLARQTGLTRNQVSNWFINARVRLWKPMVEEMYLEESKENEDKEAEGETSSSSAAENKNHFRHHHQFKSLPTEYPFGANNISRSTVGAAELQAPVFLNYGSQIRFGDPGDVSLTLGLQQSVNMPAENNNNRFSL